MSHLHGGWSEKGEICESESVLAEQQDGDGEGQAAVHCDSRAVVDEPHQEGSSEKAHGRVKPAETDESGGVRGEVLKKCGAQASGREKSIAQSRERTGDSHDQRGGESYESDARGVEFDAAVHEALFARKEMSSERECAQQKQRVGEMEAEVDGAGSGLIVSHFPEENKKGSEERFVQSEDESSDGGDSGKMATRRGPKGPDKQTNDGEKSDTTGSTVCEFNQSGCGRVMLNDRAVAERPVVSAARAGPSGAYSGTPQDDKNVVCEDGPGVAIQRFRFGIRARRNGGEDSAGGVHDSLVSGLS